MKTYEIKCGNIQGFYDAKNIEQAFLKAMRLNNWTKDDWAKLARFREVKINKNFEITKRGKWYYQDPNYLIKPLNKELLK